MPERSPLFRVSACSPASFWALLLSCLLAADLTALAPQTSGGFQTTVRFVNQATSRRVEWGLATVPFPEGVWTRGKTFGVRGVPSELVPFGARWPDGTVRFAQCAIRTDLRGRQERLYTVEEVDSRPAAFRLSPWVASRMPAFEVTIAVGLPSGGIRAVGLRPIALVEDTRVRKTVHCRDRIPDTDLVYDLWLTFFHDQDNVHFELRLTNSRVGTPAWDQPIAWLAFAPDFAMPVVRGHFRERLVGNDLDPNGPNIVALLGPTAFFDGQGYDWWGDFLFFDPALPQPDQARRGQTFAAVFDSPNYGIATNWKASDAWGPFGYLPDPPPWITDGGRAAAVQSRLDFLQWYSSPGLEWEDRPLALMRYPATTGTQHDFGVGKFVDVFVSAMPHRIEEVRYMAGEEANRPVHFREPDGTPVRAANHPNWVVRAGRTHWSASVSPDRLGKIGVGPNLREAAHGWFGKDHEHWSSLTLSSAYLLTGSHSLRMELDNDAELFLASHPVPSLKPGSPANGIGNGRGLGRVMLTMAWNYLLTGREDVAERMRRRVEECVLPQHYGLLNGGVVQPLVVKSPDPRTIASGPLWAPWEEAQAVLGLEAAARTTGSTHARQAAWIIARNLIAEGWRSDFENTMVAYAVRYLPGGASPPVSAMTNPEYYAWPSSPQSFNVWSMPSTRIAIDLARRNGDAATLQRASVIELFTERQREQPRASIGWDAYADWDAVR